MSRGGCHYLMAIQMTWPPGHRHFLPPNYDYAKAISTFNQALAEDLPDGVTGVIGITDNDRDLATGPVFDLKIRSGVKASKRTKVVVDRESMTPYAQDLVEEAVMTLEDVWDAIVLAEGYFSAKVEPPKKK